MFTAALIFSGLAAAIGLYFALVHPFVCIIQCALSKAQTGGSKILWIVLNFLFGVLASLIYSVFITDSQRLRKLTIQGFSLGMLSLALGVTISAVSPDVRNRMVALTGVTTELTPVSESTVAAADELVRESSLDVESATGEKSEEQGVRSRLETAEARLPAAGKLTSLNSIEKPQLDAATSEQHGATESILEDEDGNVPSEASADSFGDDSATESEWVADEVVAESDEFFGQDDLNWSDSANQSASLGQARDDSEYRTALSDESIELSNSNEDQQGGWASGILEAAGQLFGGSGTGAEQSPEVSAQFKENPQLSGGMPAQLGDDFGSGESSSSAASDFPTSEEPFFVGGKSEVTESKVVNRYRVENHPSAIPLLPQSVTPQQPAVRNRYTNR